MGSVFVWVDNPLQGGVAHSAGVGSLQSRIQPGPRQPCQRLCNQMHRLFNVCVGCVKAD